ncbi:MAG TPA: response regulator [Candidatus Polarisedimenticolaceae bacterium]|nr:response regulator [Candidatus Polarisedimenticolaceae bacterium]
MAAEPILIVDDNPVNLKLARVLLTAEGYAVTIAQDADEALAALERFRPRVILMDVQLPGMDGLELTRRLKADPATREIVILAMTAYAMKGDDEKALAAGCDGYLSKPIDTRNLAQLIESYLRKASPARAEPSSAPPAGDRLKAILERKGPAFLREILQLFDETTGECLPMLREALATQDASRLRWAAHKLGGGCVAIGANEAGSICRDLALLEPTASRGTAELLARLEREVEGVRRSAAELLSLHEAGGSTR